MTYKLFNETSFPELEKEIAKFWEENKVFEKSVDEVNDGQFVFYDGPPFANGLPHYGHLLTSFIKDIYARFQTMNGKKTPRRFGWDCHGLPAEMEVEKQLGIQGRYAITQYGIEKFNEKCQTSVLKYTDEWQNYIQKAGRWVDFQNDYKTMDLPYMESVIWAFKQLYEKGLVYEDHRVMPYSWKAETPLSNFETRMDNSYREKASKAVTVKFEITSGNFANHKILVWTTTPWTLPSNLMLAVNKDIDYSIINHNNEKLIVASNLVTKNFKEEVQTEKIISGNELLNLSYRPLFPYFENHQNAFKIIHGNFVTTEDGTGIVHIAPGFGEDDFELCKKVGVSIVCPVDEKGRYTAEIFDIDENHKKIEKNTSSNKNNTLNNSIDNFSTERLYAKSISKEDFSLVRGLYQNATVRKFYGKQVLSDDEVWGEINLYITLKQKFDQARMLWFEKETNEFIGIAGIDNVTIDSDEKQIGFTLHEKFWGKGYAFEIGKKLIENFGVNAISAYVKEDNTRSYKVLEKLGFVNKGVKMYERSQYERTWFVLETGVLSLKGRQVFDCNDDIIKFLKKQNSWLKTEQYLHNYPHCWRTDTPLIYKALPSWYVKVTDFKDEMVENNKNINWIPNHIKDGMFGKWLENARDWSISRNRFWGCPVPVWKSQSGAIYVFGSIKELEQFFETSYIKQYKLGKNSGHYIQKDGSFKITNLHRPYIDELTAQDPANPEYEIRRVEDVLDCWFESGSMPFASVHFPFSDARYKENPEMFSFSQLQNSTPALQQHNAAPTHFDGSSPRFSTTDGKPSVEARSPSAGNGAPPTNPKYLPHPENFPADFIVEYAAQTRGWFYTLMVLGTALFGKEPFKNCICHGVILDENGQKLSKRLRNYPDPLEVFDTIGSDAMRYFVVSSPVVVGGDLFIPRTSQGIAEILRLVIKPIWNAYNFFAMYANADKITAEKNYESKHIMDLYIFSKLHIFVRDFTKQLNEYNTQTACKLIEEFIEVLNNWYIRRNKERFWKKEQDEDKITAYNTLYTVIIDFVTTISPILPFTSEGIFIKMNRPFA